MNFKRLWLNVGIVLAVLGLVMSIFVVNDLVHIRKTMASMTGIDIYHDGYGEDTPHPLMTFTVDDQSYTRVAIETFDMDYVYGEEHEIAYDTRDPDDFVSTYLLWEKMFMFGVPLLLLGGVLILRMRHAFKGYYSEFLLRYPKACIFTVAMSLLYLVFYIWANFFYIAPNVPFGGLAVGLWQLILPFAVPISIVFVWVMALLIHRLNTRIEIEEEKIDENKK